MTKISNVTLPPEYFSLAKILEATDVSAGHFLVARMQEIWSETHGLKRARGGRPWWGRLHGHTNLISQTVKRKGFPENLPGDDHTSLWNKNGKAAAWVSTTYSYDQTELHDAAEKYGLKVTVSDYPAWRDPGLVKMIIWERA